jgi:hypothetical protein
MKYQKLGKRKEDKGNRGQTLINTNILKNKKARR